MAAARHYCWWCYGLNVEPRGRCVRCGGEIAAPEGTSYELRLVWALDHPDGDRAVTAARSLGCVGSADSYAALRSAALTHRDPYVAAEALRSLVARRGVEAERPLLERVGREGGLMTRRVAREALGDGAVSVSSNDRPRALAGAPLRGRFWPGGRWAKSES